MSRYILMHPFPPFVAGEVLDTLQGHPVASLQAEGAVLKEILSADDELLVERVERLRRRGASELWVSALLTASFAFAIEGSDVSGSGTAGAIAYWDGANTIAADTAITRTGAGALSVTSLAVTTLLAPAYPSGLTLGVVGVDEPNFYIASLDSPWCLGTNHIVDANGFRDDVLSIGYNVRAGAQTINPADVSWFMQFERGYAQAFGQNTHAEFWMGFHHPAHPGNEWRVFGATFNHDLLKGEFSVSGAFSVYGTHENAVPAGNPSFYVNDGVGGGICETYTGLIIHGDGANDSAVNRYLRLENVSPATALQTVQSAPAWSVLGAAWDTDNTVSRSIQWDLHFHPISQAVPVGQISIYESVDAAAGVERIAFIGGASPGIRFNGSPALVVDSFNELTVGGAGFANTIVQGTTVYLAPGGSIKFQLAAGGIGVFGHAAAAQTANLVPLTDSTGGTPSATTIVDVTTTGLADPAKVNNNFASISDILDNLLAHQKAHGWRAAA